MNKLIVILGPTASGKTDLAIKLARKFNGEIVCADSRQIYAGMSIGTASPNLPGTDPGRAYRGPSPVTMRHHLFHIVSPKKTFNVAQYQKLAIKTIKDIQKRGKIPFLVGGTAFYLYSVVENWQFPESKANPALRKKLEGKSSAQLFKILRKLDKVRAESIDKNNPRRLIRAIEMAKELGQAPAIIKKPQFDCLVLGLNPGPEKLKKRIQKRTKKMFKLGLEKEVKALVKKYGWTAVLQNTIGYAEWKEFHSFLQGRSETPSLIETHTLQLAKRQMTWFKRDKKIRWVKSQRQATALIKKFIPSDFQHPDT